MDGKRNFRGWELLLTVPITKTMSEEITIWNFSSLIFLLVIPYNTCYAAPIPVKMLESILYIPQETKFQIFCHVYLECLATAKMLN